MSVLVGVLQTAANKAEGPAAAFGEWNSPYVATATGTATTMSVRIWYSGGHAYKLAIYTSDGLTKLGETGSLTTPSTGTRTGALSPSVSIVSGTTYRLAAIIGTSAGGAAIQTSGSEDVTPEQSESSYTPAATVSTTPSGGNNLGYLGITADGDLAGGLGQPLTSQTFQAMRMR